jgi:hypothetical protein
MDRQSKARDHPSQKSKINPGANSSAQPEERLYGSKHVEE